MSSIFERALGEEFRALHPMMQRRFGGGLEAGYAAVGTGVMSRIRRGAWWTVPFLWFSSIRNILVPDVGDEVPFRIENYPYLDPHGRETVTFVREYRARARPSRFDATMVYSEALGGVVDYLGTHQHLAVDLQLRVVDGGLLLTSDAQRFYEGPLAFRFPMLFSGRATLREHWDDAAGRYRVHLEVHNHVLGFLFGYEGSFTCEFPAATDAPAHLKPRRHERRE